MATVKTTSGDYTINVGPYDSGNATWAGTMSVNGNLNGLVATKGTGSYAGLRFDVAANTWQVSSSVNIDGSPVAAYASIATGNATVSGANTQIQFNDSGSFGATANLTFNKALNVLTLQGSQTLGNIGTPPSSVANSVVIYNNATGPGGSGLYAITSATNDELVAYNKAKLLSIIL
jgi:hypothetical protein